MKDTSMEYIGNIRHKIIDKHLLIEVLLNNVIANYFCDSKKNAEEFLFLIMQKENFYKKIELLESLKLYENKYVSCSKREYKKGLKSIEWINNKRNNVVHNFMFIDEPTKKLIVNVVKRREVNKLEINKSFLKEFNKNTKKAISLLGGLNLEIASYRGIIKDANTKDNLD